VAILGLNGAGKTTLLRILAGCWTGHRRGRSRARLRLGYYAQEHETLDVHATILEHMRSAARQTTPSCAGSSARSCSRRRRGQAGRGALRRREDPAGLATLVCSGANVLLLDEPTNNLDP
jgi:ATPase subunit of ABC transporter with duplicated ATPase domains